MEQKYVKLSDLDGQEFTVEKAWGFTLKKWDNAARQMLVEKEWKPELLKDGYRKVYAVDTDKGKLDISQNQLKNMLEAVYSNGDASITGRTFRVKKYIGKNDFPEYFFNPVKKTEIAEPVYDVGEEPVDLNDIPF